MRPENRPMAGWQPVVREESRPIQMQTEQQGRARASARAASLQTKGADKDGISRQLCSHT